MFEKETHELLREIRDVLRAILAVLKKEQPSTVPDGVQIVQIKGGTTVPITGTNAGGTSVFEADAILAGVADPAGFPLGSSDAWTVDDTAVVLVPGQPQPNQVTVSVPATDTGASYNLTVSVQMPNVGTVTPAPLALTINVPIIQAPPPVPTGVIINQIS